MLDRTNVGTLSREDLLGIAEFTINPLSERITNAFFYGASEERIDFKKFMKTLAHLRPIKTFRQNVLNTRDEKLHFLFKMYDIDEDGVITKEELMNILLLLLGDKVDEEHLVNIAERTIVEADTSGQGIIGFQDFCRSMERIDIEKKMSIKNF